MEAMEGATQFSLAQYKQRQLKMWQGDEEIAMESVTERKCRRKQASPTERLEMGDTPLVRFCIKNSCF